MNWVGGSRNRFVVKNDAKKQREFFEKRKMQQRLKNLGVALPASPGGANVSSGSMDLVTLFIVNQIAAKKDIKDPPKVAVLGSSEGGSRRKRTEPLVLPMSPCSPSQLSLVEGQPQYSAQGTRKRKHVIPQGFKCRQLSPVLESAFSDNSASDYLQPITDHLSPFSSTSSASSGQGIFPLQLSLQQRGQTQAQLPAHCSPPPWDTSALEQTKFQPYSQPRGMTDCIPWTCGSNPPLYQLETPTAAQVLFTSPKSDNTEARDQARHEVIFSLNQPEDKEPLLDFTLNQGETEQQLEGEVFRGFSTEDNEREGSHFGSEKSKIYLKDDGPATSSAPQIVPDSQCMEVEGSDIIYLSNCTDMSFSCLEHNGSSMNGYEYSPSYSCRRGYLSSDSNDDEERCQPCLLKAACCAENLNPNQGNPNQRYTKQPRPPTPLLKPKMNIRDNQKVIENAAFQSNSSTAQFASPQAQTQSSVCKCKKTSSGTRDAGSQTVHTAETRDASTQCSVVVDAAAEATGSCLPPVDVSVQHPATGRQTETAAEPHTPPSGKAGRGEKPRTKKTSRQPGSSSINKHTDGRVILQRPINPFQDALSITDSRGKENRDGRDLMKDLLDEVREEVTSGSRANRLSEESETLQEIADILLLLKQKREVK